MNWAIFTALGLYLLIGASSVCCAHPFHISLAEMEYNAATKRMEIALKLHAIDLERELGRLAGRRVDIEKEPISGLVESYLDRHFYLLPRDQVRLIEQNKLESIDKIARSKAHYIGSEMETTWIWLFFELELPTDDAGHQRVDGWALINSVFLDSIKDQINTVTVRSGAQRHALKMSRKAVWQEFPSDWLQPPAVRADAIIRADEAGAEGSR